MRDKNNHWSWSSTKLNFHLKYLILCFFLRFSFSSIESLNFLVDRKLLRNIYNIFFLTIFVSFLYKFFSLSIKKSYQILVYIFFIQFLVSLIHNEEHVLPTTSSTRFKGLYSKNLIRKLCHCAAVPMCSLWAAREAESAVDCVPSHRIWCLFLPSFGV